MPHSNQYEIINIMGLHIGRLQPILTSSACVQLNMKQFSSKTFFKLKANLNSTYKISLKISGKIDDSTKGWQLNNSQEMELLGNHMFKSNNIKQPLAFLVFRLKFLFNYLKTR